MRNFPSLNCQLSIIPIHGFSYHNIPTGNPERVAITQPRVGRRGLPGVIAPGNPNAVGVESNPLSPSCPSMINRAHSKSTMFTNAIPEGCKRLAGRLRSSATDTPGNPTQSAPTPAGVAENSFRIYKSQSPPVGRGSCRAIIRPSPSAFFLNCCTITPPVNITVPTSITPSPSANGATPYQPGPPAQVIRHNRDKG